MTDQQMAFDITTRGSKDRQRIARVLAIVSRHVGRENSVSMHEISATTSIPTRDVQAIVKFLVEERGKAIGTATSRPFGYYVIRSLDELEDNYRHFVRRGVSNLKHARAFNKASLIGPIVGQLETEIGDKR